MTYNVLLGGEGREDLIAGVISRAAPDVVALQEVTDLALVDRLAAELGMEAVVGAPADEASPLNIVVLSRFAVTAKRNHPHPGMLRTHLEVEVRLPSRALPRVRLHAVHLAARFGEPRNGEARRMREIGAVLDDIREAAPGPHIILGDLNAVAPGDVVAATDFFARMRELQDAGVVVRGEDGFMGPIARPEDDDMEHDSRWHAVDIHPRLDVGIPRLPWVVGPATRRLPRLEMLDRLLNTRIRRDTVEHLQQLGYVDCYRELHDDAGFTCATWMPACRIDYLFADPRLAPRLESCAVVGGPGLPDPEADSASDHFPVVATFTL